jgi:hypothetical protein
MNFCVKIMRDDTVQERSEIKSDENSMLLVSDQQGREIHKMLSKNIPYTNLHHYIRI